MTKYRVSFFESERGWGSDSWVTDYYTEEEARKMVDSTNKEFCSAATAPDYYIKATYIGAVEV